MEKKKKITNGRLKAIIVTGISCVIAVALIITNLFIPVKYLASYMVAGNKGAEDGTMRVRFVDVGYGDCTIIELPDGKNMLIDGGDGSTANQSRILKFLNKCGIKTIDYLVCTSIDKEHCGGLAEIIRLKTVKTIFMPYVINYSVNDALNSLVYAARTCGAKIVCNEYGIGEYSDDYDYFFAFISPSLISNPKGEYEKYLADVSSENAKKDISAVIWLEYAGTNFLFTSDITSDVETRITNEYKLLSEVGEKYCPINGKPVRLDECNVVKVANHGSETSACIEFYDLLRPDIAVVSVGDNGQACPSDQVITDVCKYTGNENLYRTDINGTVTIEVTRDGYKIL